MDKNNKWGRNTYDILKSSLEIERMNFDFYLSIHVNKLVLTQI